MGKDTDRGKNWIIRRAMHLSHRDNIKLPIAEPQCFAADELGPPDVEGIHVIRSGIGIKIHSKHHSAAAVVTRADVDDCAYRESELPGADDARARIEEVLLGVLAELKAKEESR